MKKIGGMNSPIAWVGGKRLLRDKIIQRIAPHETYCEVFSGGAWVLFGKPPSKYEALNDLDGELVNFWRTIKHRPAMFLAELKYLVSSREIFQVLRGVDTCYLSEIVRACRFYYLNKNSFGAKMETFASGPKAGRKINFDKVEETITAAWRRLKKVTVENLDYRELVRRFDRPDTFFYLDPPYVDCPGCYVHDFTDDDHRALAETLKGLRGKFLLSYNDHELIRNLYTRPGISFDNVDVNYSINQKKSIQVCELIITNY